MRARILLPLVLIAAVLASACGGATGVVLKIHSGYPVPAEVDALLVHLENPNHPPRDERIELSTRFPHSLVIQTDDLTGELTVQVRALKGEQVVTTSQFGVTLREGELLTYELTL